MSTSPLSPPPSQPCTAYHTPVTVHSPTLTTHSRSRRCSSTLCLFRCPPPSHHSDAPPRPTTHGRMLLPSRSHHLNLRWPTGILQKHAATEHSERIRETEPSDGSHLCAWRWNRRVDVEPLTDKTVRAAIRGFHSSSSNAKRVDLFTPHETSAKLHHRIVACRSRFLGLSRLLLFLAPPPGHQHAACHVSRVTCHMVRVTCVILNVTCRMSHVMCVCVCVCRSPADAQSIRVVRLARVACGIDEVVSRRTQPLVVHTGGCGHRSTRRL